MKTERIGMMSLVFGLVLLFLAAIFTYLGLFSWLGLSCYSSGLFFTLLSLSYTKYKVYAKYFVTMLLICGATVAVLEWFLLPPVSTLKSLTLASGTGVFAGGLGNLMAASLENVNERKWTK